MWRDIVAYFIIDLAKSCYRFLLILTGIIGGGYIIFRIAWHLWYAQMSGSTRIFMSAFATMAMCSIIGLLDPIYQDISLPEPIRDTAHWGQVLISWFIIAYLFWLFGLWGHREDEK